jgi:PAS domain S-box-containing protein
VNAPAPSTSRRLSVLVVDDDEDDFVILRDLLEEAPNASFEVQWIDNIDDGLTEVRRQRHDLYVIDHRLGGADGLDLLRAATAAGCTRPMIMMTSTRNIAVEEAAIAAGATDYLIKGTVNVDLVEAAIRHALDRAQVQARLRESEERYALAIRGANDGIWDWNLRADRIHYSARWKEMLGYREEELGSRPAEWLERIHPDDLPDVRERIDAHVRGETPYFECESRLLHRDGSYRWMLVRGLAVRDVEGVATRMAGSQTDVTDRRMATENMLSHVSHELRTPLAAIYQFASLVRDEVAGPTNEEQRDLLDSSLRNCRHLRKMINDMMEAVRANTGKLEVDPRRVAILQLIDECVRTLRAAASDRGIELRTELPSSLPELFADPDRVRQVLINLVDNACKFTPEGGRIMVRAGIDAEHRDFVRISVEDTGYGIDPAAHERIFGRLCQEEAGQASRRGIGLGLYLCRELITRQGGEIGVESEPGRGSRFSFTLPLAAPTWALRPVVTRHLRTGDPIGVVSLRIGGAEEQSTDVPRLRDAHARIRTLIDKERDVVLPATMLGEDPDAGIHVLTCGTPSRTESLRNRLLEALSSHLASQRVEPRLELATRMFDLPVDDVGLDELARRLNERLPTLLARSGDAEEERT